MFVVYYSEMDIAKWTGGKQPYYTLAELGFEGKVKLNLFDTREGAEEYYNTQIVKELYTVYCKIREHVGKDANDNNFGYMFYMGYPLDLDTIEQFKEYIDARKQPIDNTRLTHTSEYAHQDYNSLLEYQCQYLSQCIYESKRWEQRGMTMVRKLDAIPGNGVEDYEFNVRFFKIAEIVNGECTIELEEGYDYQIG